MWARHDSEGWNADTCANRCREEGHPGNTIVQALLSAISIVNNHLFTAYRIKIFRFHRYISSVGCSLRDSPNIPSSSSWPSSHFAPPIVFKTKVHAYNGCEHTLVVLDDGQMVSFGYNYRGQLGHGNTASEPVPKPVRGLDGIRVTQVSCSYYHSVIACNNGEVMRIG